MFYKHNKIIFTFCIAVYILGEEKCFKQNIRYSAAD